MNQFGRLHTARLMHLGCLPRIPYLVGRSAQIRGLGGRNPRVGILLLLRSGILGVGTFRSGNARIIPIVFISLTLTGRRRGSVAVEGIFENSLSVQLMFQRWYNLRFCRMVVRPESHPAAGAEGWNVGRAGLAFLVLQVRQKQGAAEFRVGRTLVRSGLSLLAVIRGCWTIVRATMTIV